MKSFWRAETMERQRMRTLKRKSVTDTTIRKIDLHNCILSLWWKTKQMHEKYTYSILCYRCFSSKELQALPDNKSCRLNIQNGTGSIVAILYQKLTKKGMEQYYRDLWSLRYSRILIPFSFLKKRDICSASVKLKSEVI